MDRATRTPVRKLDDDAIIWLLTPKKGPENARTTPALEMELRVTVHPVGKDIRYFANFRHDNQGSYAGSRPEFHHAILWWFMSITAVFASSFHSFTFHFPQCSLIRSYAAKSWFVKARSLHGDAVRPSQGDSGSRVLRHVKARSDMALGRKMIYSSGWILWSSG